MDEQPVIATPVYINFGKSHCDRCKGAPYINVWGTRVDVCSKCMAGIDAMLVQDPERIVAYDASKGSFFYTAGVRPGPDSVNPDATGAGDHDTPYYFGMLPTLERMMLHPYPFSNIQLVRLMKLRTTVQNARLAARMRATDPDGF